MDWQVRAKQDAVVDDAMRARLASLRRSLAEPNPQDSFRTLLEPVLEDSIVGGFGAMEIELTGDDGAPVRLWPVDGATVAVDGSWDGASDSPRYLQTVVGGAKSVPLLDRELMYVRLNSRSYTPFGLGRLEVAFETINHFLSAHRFDCGRL